MAIGLIISFAADMILIDRTDGTAFMKGMILFFVALLVYSTTLICASGYSLAGPLLRPRTPRHIMRSSYAYYGKGSESSKSPS